MSEPLFKVTNHHTDSCGEPPGIDGDTPNVYFGYFANQHGEQAIYLYDYSAREATVRMGDAGWDGVYRVVDGRAEGLMLNEAELTWLRACWLATAKSGT
jgi:hypothetical protein